MKIVQLLYSGLGGHGSVAFSLVGAAGERWQSAMVFVGIEPVLDEYEDRCLENDVPWQHVHTQAGRAFTSWPALYSALSKMAPDAIILHSVKTIVPCALYARSRNIPLIAVEHQPNALKKSSEWWVSRALMRWADAVVVLTPEYKTEVAEGLGKRFKDEKVTLIPNGIDTGFFYEKPKQARAGRRKIGMAARFSGTKRQDLMVEALQKLLQRDGAGSWSLSLAGDGETHPSVKRQVEEMGLLGSVDLPGFLKGTELRDWFQSLDVYAHATEGETLSTSLLQAMASGLPIVGSDVDGVRNLLALYGGTGMVAYSQNAEGFADALALLAAEPERSQRISSNARHLAEVRFSDNAMFAAYDELIRKCILEQ